MRIKTRWGTHHLQESEDEDHSRHFVTKISPTDLLKIRLQGRIMWKKCRRHFADSSIKPEQGPVKQSQTPLVEVVMAGADKSSLQGKRSVLQGSLRRWLGFINPTVSNTVRAQGAKGGAP